MFRLRETHITTDILALGNTRRGATHITVTLQQFLSSRPTQRQEEAEQLPHTKDHQGLSFSFDTRRALETEISKWSLLVFVGFAVKPLILEHPSFFLQVRNNGGDPFPGGVPPYMGHIGMCRCEGYVFQAVYSSIGYINRSVWSRIGYHFSRN